MGDLCPELTARQRPVCICGKGMEVRRSNALSLFWSCPRFPVCKFTKPIDQDRFLAYIGKRDARRISAP
jgi:ssDNA-binding Zn-finger/Zn-ribbon topoisomerase 1